MTQLKMFNAAEAVRENLNVPGSVCAEAECWGFHRTGEAARRRVTWRLSFVPQGGNGHDCVQEAGENPQSVMTLWTERMRLKYGPKHVPTEGELAEVLDAHKVEAA